MRLKRVTLSVALVVGILIGPGLAYAESADTVAETAPSTFVAPMNPSSVNAVITWRAVELWDATVRWQTVEWQNAHPVHHQSTSTHGTSSGAKECTANAENGGDYGRSSNPTHFGRYQFDRSTWAANGGDPATWGTASPSEQDQVFDRAWAATGGKAWTPYNGCR